MEDRLERLRPLTEGRAGELVRELLEEIQELRHGI